MFQLKKISDEAVCSLVEDRLKIMESAGAKFLWCTISPNPNAKHPCWKVSNGKRISVQIPYGKLPQKSQYDYCLRVLSCYNYSDKTNIYGTWELNKSGDVHLHFVMHDPSIKSETMLQIFRRDILNCEIVMKNMKKGGKMVDYMNNIVFVNDSLDARFKYMKKDKDNIQIFPYYVKMDEDNEQSKEESEEPRGQARVEGGAPSALAPSNKKENKNKI